MQAVYSHVDDVDLYVGLVSERADRGALVGPTALCIIGDQFARLKKGDRYWYELGGQQGSFTLAQLAQVLHSSRVF